MAIIIMKNVFSKGVFMFLVIILCSSMICGQDVAELDRRNGFKDIKMTSSITEYEGLEFKKAINSPIFPSAYQYTPKKGYYESIGSIKIHSLEVNTYDSAIYEIRLIVDKDPNLYKGLKKAFGEPEFHYRSNKYFWKTDNLRLFYDSHSKNKIEMVYFSYLMTQRLKEDKEEVVEEIMDDF